jgi:hypothetical protein
MTGEDVPRPILPKARVDEPQLRELAVPISNIFELIDKYVTNLFP